jgi:hypothetical protein
MKPEADQLPLVNTANPFVRRMRRQKKSATADEYAGVSGHAGVLTRPRVVPWEAVRVDALHAERHAEADVVDEHA